MSQRSDQVAEELRKIMSMILIDDLSDPRLGFMTITQVKVSDDLRHARVSYSVLGSEEKAKDTKEALAENIGFIRRLAVQRLNLRYAMQIDLENDHSIEHSMRIDEILRKINKEENKKDR